MLIDVQTQNLHTTIDRISYSQNNHKKGITLICFGGLHGNELAGIKGLANVISELRAKNLRLNGNFYAIAGNKTALEKEVRFIDSDLNRLWTHQDIQVIRNEQSLQSSEQREQKELLSVITEILNRHDGPFIFIDFHTTSSATKPFITISDSLNNRELAKAFNIPIVLGIEEFLDGPLLSYINEFGHVAIGLEAGQHDDEMSIWHCEGFVWLVMEHLKLVKKQDFQFDEFNRLLNIENSFYEIIYRHDIVSVDQFEMLDGFENFTSIKKGQELAFQDGKMLKSPYDGLIFMPLYQSQGEDGFFIIRKISKPWLLLSSVLRNLRFHQLLRILPGIHKHPEHPYGLIADKRIARFLTTKVFHLFGYRKKIDQGESIHFIKRDRKISSFD